MRLKTFYAKTMTEAMQMVRDTLGEDAVIVATQEEKGGKAVRITAAIDPADYNQTAPKNTPDDWLQYDTEEEAESALADELTDILLRHNLPQEVMDQILSCATIVGLENPQIALTAALEHLFIFRPLPQKSYKKPLMLMGPPGAGKTLAAAKIAARGHMNGLRVAAITCDTTRAGGYEQLAAFTKLLEIPLHRAQNAAQLKEALFKVQSFDQVLIDTAGINPFSTEEVKETARLASTVECESILVLPGGLDAQESADIGKIFSSLGAAGLMGARLDMARRLGGLLAAAQSGGLYLTDISNTSKVAQGLAPMSPEALTSLLMPRINRPTAKSARTS